MAIINLFVEGGTVGMCVLTLLFIALFFAAWKAPAWVRETGLAALAGGFLWSIIGFMQMGHVIPECAPDVDMYIVWGGVRVALIPAAYGLIIYIVSLIIRIVHKPRL